MQPKEKMAETMGWVEDFSHGQVRGIGALALILPLLTGVAPVLTPLAAVGLALRMIGAFMIYLRRKEMVPMGVVNMMLFAMAAFVAYGRF